LKEEKCLHDGLKGEIIAGNSKSNGIDEEPEPGDEREQSSDGEQKRRQLYRLLAFDDSGDDGKSDARQELLATLRVTRYEVAKKTKVLTRLHHALCPAGAH
jgi:hypothetical protein